MPRICYFFDASTRARAHTTPPPLHPPSQLTELTQADGICTLSNTAQVLPMAVLWPHPLHPEMTRVSSSHPGAMWARGGTYVAFINTCPSSKIQERQCDEQWRMASMSSLPKPLISSTFIRPPRKALLGIKKIYMKVLYCNTPVC